MNDLELKENLKKYSGIKICPVRNVIARFSGKWSMLVLCLLAESETTRFNTIGKAIPDISAKVLRDTLKGLESDRLISRKVYAEVPPRVEYALTPIGRSLMPHIHGLVDWAAEHFDDITRNKEERP